MPKKLYRDVTSTKTYKDLAAATHVSCSSEINPLPIGVGKKGRLFDRTKEFTSYSALQKAAPMQNYSR